MTKKISWEHPLHFTVKAKSGQLTEKNIKSQRKYKQCIEAFCTDTSVPEKLF